MIKQYNVIAYFDVWGNARDGFEVNNQCHHTFEGKYAIIELESELEGDAFTLALQDELKRVDFFRPSINRRLWSIDWNCFDANYMELEQSNGRPIGRVELVRESE
jgi:hypothetical protein